MPDAFFLNKQTNRNLKHPLRDETFSYSEGQSGCLCRTVEEGSPHSPKSHFINISPPFLTPSPATQVIQTLGRGGGTEKCHSCLFPPAAPKRRGFWRTTAEHSWWDPALIQPLMGVHQSICLCRNHQLKEAVPEVTTEVFFSIIYGWGFLSYLGAFVNFVPNPFSSHISLNSLEN